MSRNEDTNESGIMEYTVEIESLFIQFLISHPELFIRCKGILKSGYFDDRKNRETVKFIEDYSNEYSILPSIEQIQAITGKTIELIPDVAIKNDKWFLTEIETFCRYRSLREVIYASPDLLDQGKYRRSRKSC